MSSAPADARRRGVPAALAISGAALLLFVGWTLFIQPAADPPSFDWHTAHAMGDFAESNAGIRAVFVALTFLGDVPALACLAAAGVLTSLALGQRQLALCWLFAAAGGGLLDYVLKVSLDRPRPPAAIRDAAVTETNESYPSGHSMGSIIGFGMVGYAGCRLPRRSGPRALLLITLAILIVLIGTSRIVLRAHWFSDVVAGFLIGGSWLALWIAATECMLGRAAQQKSPGG